MAPDTPPRGPERIRHPLKLRMASVLTVTRLTPAMVRVVLYSPEFSDFASLAHDDHVKLFFPASGSKTLPEPQAGPDGLRFPAGERPQARDYTPRAFDTGACTLTIDFVLHGEGPAARWAAAAQPGDVIGVGGPRGSFVLRGAFDWYLLIGDEAALPAIGRRLEELPASAKVTALVSVANAAETQRIEGPQGCEIKWILRDGNDPSDPAPLVSTLEATPLPSGEGYIFIAGEASVSRALREHFVSRLGHNPDWIKAAGYWQAGESDFDDGHAH
ncbi:siderophore-interacting protein [Pelagibacterium montanilacus]|uniref:siderophore-interacting protein n=1 Tax=Pelagibacterium montanilacus TaxID=2185280 RepID=UPI000F8EB963|nr:siderophore-interacting protein [Pelagibacterium montanilacus]